MAGFTRNLPITRVAQQIALALSSPPLTLWALYLLLVPVYIFKSGLPQPGDVLILALVPAALTIWDRKLARPSIRSLQPYLLLVGWMIVVNTSWAIAMGRFGLWGKENFLISPMFYVYNFLLYGATLILHRRFGAHFISLTLHVLLVTALLQVAFSFVFRTGSARQAVLFNQANQLGFYALVTANILALARRELAFGPIKTIVGQLACLYLSMISASKAALAGTAILFVVATLRTPRTMIAAGLLAMAAITFTPLGDVADRAHHRIANDETLGFFEERGYDRIMQHKEHWLLGSGEGGYDRFRFTTKIGDHELHSSAGTLFFCYGVLGVLLFAVFLYRVVEGSRFTMALLLVPSLSFGLTHQGLRFSLLWILFAIYVAVKQPLATASTGKEGST